ncbi:MAG: hypothetical protein A2X77_03320 [Gammaproteobacteria bacterium GWE2_42_36]|nr:MAG: hypothetical protein A2X77_03320 [Gammaproteobacteria bacterium GWE2_42_36]
MMILVFLGNNQEDTSLRGDALLLKKRLEQKIKNNKREGAKESADVPVFLLPNDEKKLEQFVQSSRGKAETKVHILAHGNQRVCANHTVKELAAFLAPYLERLRHVEKISLLFCYSAAINGKEKPFAQALCDEVCAQLQNKRQKGSITVKGCCGFAMTDSEGRTWVWTEKATNCDAKKTKLETSKSKEREQSLLVDYEKEGLLIRHKKENNNTFTQFFKPTNNHAVDMSNQKQQKSNTQRHIAVKR